MSGLGIYLSTMAASQSDISEALILKPLQERDAEDSFWECVLYILL